MSEKRNKKLNNLYKNVDLYHQIIVNHNKNLSQIEHRNTYLKQQYEQNKSRLPPPLPGQYKTDFKYINLPYVTVHSIQRNRPKYIKKITNQLRSLSK